nr:MAG TPA: hypothetical protein [Caudoviricetes sp.]
MYCFVKCGYFKSRDVFRKKKVDILISIVYNDVN